MKSEFKIGNDSLIRIETVVTFEEILTYVSQSENNRYGLKDMIVSRVASNIAEKFVEKYALDVMKLIDQQSVANLIALQAAGKMSGR